MAIFNEEKIFELLNEGSINLNRNPLGIKDVSMIIVHNNEGDNIPHFHIKRNGKHDCCIMFNENRYFNHGVNNGTLTSKEMKELDKWLRKVNFGDKLNQTNFQILCDFWNDASHTIVADKNRLFDYSNIASYK